MRHLLEIDDLNPSELKKVIALSLAEASPKVLNAKGVALIFEKPSGRTRNSMEMAVNQLGGHPVYIQPEELGSRLSLQTKYAELDAAVGTYWSCRHYLLSKPYE